MGWWQGSGSSDFEWKLIGKPFLLFKACGSWTGLCIRRRELS